MPYEKRASGNKTCVYKKGSDSPLHCYSGDTADSQATDYMRALYANEKKELEESLADLESAPSATPPSSDIVKAQDSEEKDYCSPYDWRAYLGATSFAEMDSYQETNKKAMVIREVNYQFRSLMDNIINDPDVEDKAVAMNSLITEYQGRLTQAKGPNFMSLVKEIFSPIDPDAELIKAAIKRENGLDFPARDYAFAPDPTKPATWQIRLTESPGKITIAQLGRAAASLSSGGFRGQTAAIPPAALNAVKRRIRAEYRKLGIADAQLPAAVREGTVVAASKELPPNSFSIWKDDSTNTYYWMAVYSNNFRDNDNPPEIIKEQSHKAFTYLANEGILPMPELWHWHTEGTQWGITKQLDYVDGFAIAIGEVLPGFESHAELLKDRTDLGVSHGMKKRFILRDPADPSCIDFHVTHEISDLPVSKAANKHTGFFVIKEQEDDMPFTPDKRDYLKNLGYSEDNISLLETNLLGTKKALTSAGVESKEATPPPPATDTETQKEAPITRTELVEFMGNVVGPLMVSIQNLETTNTALKEQMGGLESQIKELSVADSDKIAKAAGATPAASLGEMMAAQLTKQARVPENSPLLAKAAKETAAPATQFTPSGFLNGIITNSHKAPGQ